MRVTFAVKTAGSTSVGKPVTPGTSPERDYAPGFHFLRHLLSVVILAFHGYVLTFGGNGNIGYAKGALLATADHLTAKQWIIEILRPGLFALVGIFFALSGYLVMGSALRTRNLRQFMTLRCLRILPALCTEVTLSAFILGPLVTTLPLAAYFADPTTYGYFGNIVGFFQFTLPGVFTANPMPNFVNINLWTLHAEFLCYATVGVLMATGLLYRTRALTVLVTLVLVGAAVAVRIPALGLQDRFEATHFQSWFLVVLFALGLLFRAHKDALRVSRFGFVAAGIGYFALMLLGWCDALAAVLLTYVMVCIGSMRFTWFDRLVRDDLSYGIYLYGYPITQGLIFFLGSHLSGLPGPARLAIVVTASVGATILFAFASWRIVEKPALKLKAFVLPARRPPVSPPALSPIEVR